MGMRQQIDAPAARLYEGIGMKIVIPGGSGQVGTILARSFAAGGHEVVVLSRNPQPAPWVVVKWNGRSQGAWVDTLEGADVVVNLAGRSVNCRYHAANQKTIMDSRIESTNVVGEVIGQLANPPHTWLQMSTATIYAHRFDAPNDELMGQLGSSSGVGLPKWHFSIDVAKRWEEAAQSFVLPQTRTVLLRSAMVMSPDRGGVFDTLLGLVRVGLGGRVGSGKQFVSWIHEQDFVRAVRWLIEHDEIEGVVNLAAPTPLPQAALMKALRQAWGMPLGLPASGWLLEAGAWVMRTETELILKSRRVVSAKLAQAGFAFDFSEWPQAADDLVRRWRLRQG